MTTTSRPSSDAEPDDELVVIKLLIEMSWTSTGNSPTSAASICRKPPPRMPRSWGGSRTRTKAASPTSWLADNTTKGAASGLTHPRRRNPENTITKEA